MSHRFWGWIIGTVLIAVSVVTTLTAAAQGGTIVYFPLISRADPPILPLSNFRGLVSVSDGNDSDIYTLRPDGSDVVTLTDNDQNDNYPALSPTATWVSYVRSMGTTTAPHDQVWVVRPDGTDAHMLLEGDGRFSNTTWSPDGNRIAVRQYANGSDSLYITAPDVVTPTVAVTGTNIATGPVWSPDSNYLAYNVATGTSSNYLLYTVASTGGTPLLVTDVSSYSFDWSPTSTLLSFTVERNGGSDVAVVEPDGEAFRYLTGTSENEYGATWVDGGSTLLVSRGTDFPMQLILLSPVDGSETPFTAPRPNGVQLRGVSKDGKQVLWVDGSTLQWQLIDSTTPTALGTFNMATLASPPMWSDDLHYAIWNEVFLVSPNITYYEVATVDFTTSPPTVERISAARTSLWLPGTHTFSLSYAPPNGTGYQATLWDLDTDTQTPIPFNGQNFDLFIADWWVDAP